MLIIQAGATRPHVDPVLAKSWRAAVHSLPVEVLSRFEEPVTGRNYYQVMIQPSTDISYMSELGRGWIGDGGPVILLLNAAMRLVAASAPFDIDSRSADYPGNARSGEGRDSRGRSGAGAVRKAGPGAAMSGGARAVEARFVEVPGADVFGLHGFAVATVAAMEMPLTDVIVGRLDAGEREDVAYHRPGRVGDLLFNWFD